MNRHQGALPSFAASFSARAVRALARVGVLLIAARLYPIEEVGEFAFRSVSARSSLDCWILA